MSRHRLCRHFGGAACFFGGSVRAETLFGPTDGNVTNFGLSLALLLTGRLLLL